jgi:ComF family protein
MKLLDRAIGLLFPNVCEFCAKNEAGPDESFICRDCRETPEAIIPIKRPFCEVCGLPYRGAITTEFECSNCADLNLQFKSARAAAHFTELVQETIHRYKYTRHEWFEPFLAELLIDAARPALAAEPPHVITPIPLYPTRRRFRGFNQAERLAARLGAALEIPCDPKLLRRVKNTDSQVNLGRNERVANVKGAFAYAGQEPLNGQRVLLIDDVLTMGVTASACAKVLRENGAGEVIVWTVARGGIPR